MKIKKVIATSLCAVMLASTSTVFAQTSLLSNKELYEVNTYSGSKEAQLINGSLTDSRYHQPNSIVKLPNGDFLISDTLNHTIRKLSEKEVASFAGSPIGFTTLNEAIGGYHDDISVDAAFNSPSGLAVDKHNNVYVADSENHVIRKISADGEVTTLAGTTMLGHADGKSDQAQFYYPSDVAIDSKGNVYIADTLNHAIRKITPEGIVSTINALSNRIVEYTPGYPEFAGDFADGPLASAKFNEPTNIVVDSKDNLYVSDRGNQRIRYIDFTANAVSTVAGSGELKEDHFYVEGAFNDGEAAQAQFNSPEGLLLVDDKVLIVADRSNHIVRVINNGKVNTLVGTPEEFGEANGVLSSATLNEPSDIAMTEDGALLVVEAGYNRIRLVDSYIATSDLTDATQLQVLVNGKLITTDEPSYIVQSSTVIPIRAIGEALGLDVSYDTNQRIVLASAEKQYIFHVESNKVTVATAEGSETIELDVGVQLKNSRSFVPVRFVSEQLGYHVAWDKHMKNVIIRNKAAE